MNTETFLQALQPHEGKALVFNLGGRQVSPGYHVTEVKAVTIESMDCGGKSNAWKETVVQLWAPLAKPEEGYMSVRKFLGIYGKVASSVPVTDTALLRVEYGDVGEPAIGYLVSGVEVGQDVMTVHLEAPGVACKASDRAVGDVPSVSQPSASTCCGPQLAVVGCCG